MKGKQIVAIDVGSTNVVIAVGTVVDEERIDIIGITSEPVQGVNAGRVENSETVGRAVRAAKERIENQLGIKITEAYAGLSGDFIRCVQVTDHVYVQDDQDNGCNQITERDLESLHRRMQSVKLPDDKEEIITKEPLRYMADNKEVAEPVGAYGHVLTGTYNFILADHTMRERLLHCLLKQDITVKKFVPNALVAHLGVATTEDMEEGAVIINLGGGITDVTVLLNGKVRYIASIPIGMDSINADIRAYGIPSNYVEGLKVNYGSAVHDLTTDDKIPSHTCVRVLQRVFFAAT
jgi:cell division protein FtsA